MHRLFVTIISTVLIINSRCSIASETTKQSSLDIPKTKIDRSDDEVLLCFVLTPPTSRFAKTLTKNKRRSALRPPGDKKKSSYSQDKLLLLTPPTARNETRSSLRPPKNGKKLYSDDDEVIPYSDDDVVIP